MLVVARKLLLKLMLTFSRIDEYVFSMRQTFSWLLLTKRHLCVTAHDVEQKGYRPRQHKDY